MLGVYGFVVYLSGPLLLVLLGLAVRGLFVPTRRGGTESRPLIVLLTSLGVGLALAPDVTAQFTWRYQLPMILLVPVAAALAWTRLQERPGRAHRPSRRPRRGRARDRPGGPEGSAQARGTLATPSTD